LKYIFYLQQDKLELGLVLWVILYSTRRAQKERERERGGGEKEGRTREGVKKGDCILAEEGQRRSAGDINIKNIK